MRQRNRARTGIIDRRELREKREHRRRNRAERRRNREKKK
jgi:hypothetical protein